MSFANVTVCGNLGADAEVRVTGGGKSVTKFRVAVSRTWKDGQGQKQEDTLWLTCQDWGTRPEFIRNGLVKGASVVVTGTLREETWEKGGVKQYRMIVNVDGIEVFQRADRREQPAQNGQQTEDHGDLPFAICVIGQEEELWWKNRAENAAQ